MKVCKKYMGVLLCAIMILGISIPVSAKEIDPYQEVINELNDEYSMNIHFMTNEERGVYLASTQNNIDITPEEFENQLREAIVKNNQAKEEADRKFEELEEKQVVETGSGICSMTSEPESRAKSTVTRSKSIAGATAHLNATVSNTPGYWMYSSINNVYTTYVNGVNSTPPFYARTYNYSLIDARRTCALKLYGYTLGNYGVIIDNNAYRYVEFWAGSGM